MKTKRHIKLLLEEFTRNGEVAYSGTNTSGGCAKDWHRLEREGLVKRQLPSGRGCLGHPFGYDITDAGRQACKDILNGGDR